MKTCRTCGDEDLLNDDGLCSSCADRCCEPEADEAVIESLAEHGHYDDGFEFEFEDADEAEDDEFFD